MTAFSIVTVTWECAGALGQLIASMNLQLRDDVELVVVDNASSDGPRKALIEWKGPQKFIELEENIGFGAANNIGVKEAEHDAVVLLNPDTEVVSGLEELAETARRDGCLAGPRILNSDGSVQPSASGPSVGVWPWVRAIVPGPLTPSRLAARLAPWRSETPMKVTWLTGACVASSRSRLLYLGPFDPSIHLFAEDLDLGLRAQREGIESWFRPDLATIVHHGDASASLRYEDSGWSAAAQNQRAVLERTYGAKAEKRAWRAELVRLHLNVGLRRVLGRDSSHERRILRATRRARTADRLPPLS